MKVSTTLTRYTARYFCGRFKIYVWIKRDKGAHTHICKNTHISRRNCVFALWWKFILVCIHCYMIFHVTQSSNGVLVLLFWNQHISYWSHGSIKRTRQNHTDTLHLYTTVQWPYTTATPIIYFCANFVCCVCIILEFEYTEGIRLFLLLGR